MNTQSAEQFIEKLAEECTCTPLSDRPCAGLMAGGLCDNLQMGRGHDTDDEPDDYREPEDL